MRRYKDCQDPCGANALAAVLAGVRALDAGKARVTVERRQPVILYVVPACQRCAAARRQLAELKIPFVERNVAGDFGALRAMYELSRQRQVPVVDDCGAVYVLPDEADIERIAQFRFEPD